MSHETDTPQQPQIQLEELARPEEALTTEESGEVKGGFGTTTTLSSGAPDEPTVGLLLPAVQAAREAARRSQG
jgi:hypothetical protein